jgi:hypothetical protein
MDKQVQSGKDMDCVSDQKGPRIPQVILPEYSCSFAKTLFSSKKLPISGIDGFRYQDPQSSPTMNSGLSPKEANEENHQRNYEPNKGIDARQNAYAGSSI